MILTCKRKEPRHYSPVTVVFRKPRRERERESEGKRKSLGNWEFVRWVAFFFGMPQHQPESITAWLGISRQEAVGRRGVRGTTNGEISEQRTGWGPFKSEVDNKVRNTLAGGKFGQSETRV